MAEGIEAAAQAFAEDLGGNSATRNSARPREEEGGENGVVERLDNPSHNFLEPGGGDPDFVDDGEAGGDAGEGRGNEPSARDASGRFLPQGKKPAPAKEPQGERRSLTLEEALEDPLDDEPGGESDEAGDVNDEGQSRRPYQMSELDQDAEVEVKVDGKPVKVKLNEALNGYIRQETFHQRLTQLDTSVKETRKLRDQVDQGRGFYIAQLEEMQRQLDSLAPKEPDWDARYREAPNEAPREQAAWIKYKEGRAAIDATLKAEKTKQDEAAQVARNEFIEDHNRRFTAAHPEYVEPNNGAKLWARDKEGMKKTAKDHGFSDEEIANTHDSRYLEILLKASKYDRLKARMPVATRAQPADTKRSAGGASRTPARSNGATRRLAKTGSVADAADVFAQEIAREG